MEQVLAAKKRKNKLNNMSTVAAICVYVPVVVFLLACLLPFIMVLSTSFSESKQIEEFGVSLFPRGLSFDAYKTIFIYPDEILLGYKNSIIITLIGTLCNVALCIMAAYPLSKLDFKFRGMLSLSLFLSTAFSAGIVPQYMLYKNILHIYNTWWVLILPQIGNVGHVIFLRVFFQAIDNTYYEAARIEGANEFGIMWKIAVPLIAPGIATVTFYSVLMYWNDASSALYFLDPASTEYMPISVYITRMSQLIIFLQDVQKGMYPGISLGDMDIPEYTLQTAVVVITVAPMLCVFTFFQKYFVRGLTTGGIK